ncbi:MAG: FAD-binding oxidoreductase [Candidatus Magasanikbacteria bacterium]
MRTLLYNIKTSELTPGGILRLTAVPMRPRDRMYYKPGQYAMIAYELSKEYQKFHSFSIVSSPLDEHISFAIKVSGPFTQSLASLPIGSLIAVRGPYGSFVLREHDTKDSVLFAAGIGITPFVSMLRYAHETQQPQNIHLLYSVRSSCDVPFIDIINHIGEDNSRIRPTITVTGGEDIVPHGFIKGRVSKELIESIIPRSIHATRFYICGPSVFIHAVEDMLTELAVRQKYVYTEDFVPSARVLWKQPVPLVASTAAIAASVFVFSLATNAHDVSAFADKSFNRLNTIFNATDVNAAVTKQREQVLSQEQYETYSVPQITTVLVPRQTAEQISVMEQTVVTKQVTAQPIPQAAPAVVQNPPRSTSLAPQQVATPAPAAVQPKPVIMPTPPPPRTQVS